MTWFGWFRRNIVSSQVVARKANRLRKRALREAMKKIKQDELTDRHSFALYLQLIDAQYASLQNDIENATSLTNYTKVRADKLAETRQLLDFFGQDHAELARLFQIVAQKAREAERIDELKQEKLTSVDLSKLRTKFDALSGEER
jgi:hypothetical protein